MLGWVIAVAVVGLLVVGLVILNRALRRYSERRTVRPQRLFDAVSRTDLEEIRRLVDEGQPVNIVDQRGITPLSYALESDRLEVALLLFELGAVAADERETAQIARAKRPPRPKPKPRLDPVEIRATPDPDEGHSTQVAQAVSWFLEMADQINSQSPIITQTERTRWAELYEQLRAAKTRVYADALARAAGRGETRAVLIAAIKLGRPESLGQLVKLLDRSGTTEIAQVYLDCGLPRLEEAARRWASSHRHIVYDDIIREGEISRNPRFRWDTR